MTIPADLQAVALTVGPLYSVDSEPIQGVPVTVTLSAHVRITDSGAYLPSVETIVTGVMGMVTFHLVATDSTGLDLTGFTYNVVVPGLTPSNGIDIALPAEITSVRLEDMVEVEPSEGVSVWAPSQITDALITAVVNDGESTTRATIQNLVGGGGGVMSVEGRVGNVTLGDLYATNAALAGKAALTHAAQHSQGGTDPLDVAALTSGAAPSGHIPTSDGAGGVNWASGATVNHATRHYQGGADPLDVAALGSGSATDGQVPKADGSGGVAWADEAGGDLVGEIDDLTDVDTTGKSSGDLLRWNGTAWTDYTPGNAAAKNVGTGSTNVAAGNDARFLRRREIVYDTVAEDWPTVPALDTALYQANWWQSTYTVDAATPPEDRWVENDWWDRADGAPWPLP